MVNECGWLMYNFNVSGIFYELICNLVASLLLKKNKCRASILCDFSIVLDAGNTIR